MDYPAGIDFAWFACDRDGQVAAFVTAGHGPVPHAVLRLPEDVDPEALCTQSPPRCDAESLLADGNPASYLAIARRGVHVYDWQDVHRTRAESRNVYELVARPARPCTLADLPGELAEHAAAARFESLSFAQVRDIDPRLLTPCEQGPDW